MTHGPSRSTLHATYGELEALIRGGDCNSPYVKEQGIPFRLKHRPFYMMAAGATSLLLHLSSWEK